MPPWCAADTSCWPSPRGPTKTPELWGPCFTPVAKNSSRRPSLKHWLVLMFLEQAMGAATEMTRELLRSLIDRFLKELPPIYGAQWLLAWQNDVAYC
jgi:hypothetical protein